MELIRGLYNLLPRHRGCVASIGNFDGLHLGHQQVLRQLRECAEAHGLPSVVAAFEPAPREYLDPNPPPRLMRFREKFETMRDLGVDRFLLLRFDETLRTMPPETFVQTILVEGLAVKFLSVGRDFRYGHERSGDFAALCAAGEEHGFTVETTPDFEVNGERVSSSAIRKHLADGEMELARTLLGRYYRMSGRVISGQSLGRELGFPTANIQIGRRVSPVRGIFAVRVSGRGLRTEDGVASVGTRPTVAGTQFLLEVHLFNFDRDLYGEHLQVDFIKKLRDEMKFSSVAEMRIQMKSDADRARQVLTATESE